MIVEEKLHGHMVEFPEVHADAAAKSVEEWKSLRSDLKAGKLAAKWDVFDIAKQGGNQHMDASESAYIARQLEHIRAGVYEIEYPELKGSRLVSTNTSVSTGKQSYTIRIMDKVGEAVVVADDAVDYPNVEVKVSEKSMGLFTLGISYQYSLQEARAAMDAGVGLIPRKAMVAREMMERKLDNIILVGDTVAGVKGLLNATDPGIVTYTASTGGGGSTLFSAKNADEILGDLHGMVHKVVSDSKEIEIPNTLLMPLSTRLFLQSKRVGDGTTGTVLATFLGNDPYINMIEALHQLESNTAWTGRRITAYRRDPSALDLIVSQPFEQVNPQQIGMITRTWCRMRTGGLAIYRPASIVRMDNI